MVAGVGDLVHLDIPALICLAAGLTATIITDAPFVRFRIWAAVVVGKDGNYTVTSGKVVGLFVALLVIVSPTRFLSLWTKRLVS